MTQSEVILLRNRIEASEKLSASNKKSIMEIFSELADFREKFEKIEKNGANLDETWAREIESQLMSLTAKMAKNKEESKNKFKSLDD